MIRPAFSFASAPIARVLSLSLAAFLLTACGDDGGGTGGGGDATVELVGERAGLLIWRAVPSATRYSMEILAANDSSLWIYNTADTVGQLPPTYASATGHTWWVRAFDDRRQIGESSKARMY